jgi:(E)-4-hydroxy-3-methylbut-2-enyl-diphosphate synthase
MTRYGNTPKGMAVSAMEFIRIMAAENFNRLVLSMKSSNSLIMIEATRLLVEMMQDEGYSYPLHLGVTEAGEGEDGRIRSALGIGALLREGIGDTIRVSLSEPPEDEIPVAGKIVDAAAKAPGNIQQEKISGSVLRLKYDSKDREDLTIKASVDSSLELIDRKATGLEIDNGDNLPAEMIQSIRDGILQAARIKITRNDYISCPTCGRTQFDLAAAVERVKKATSHLKGLKIAIMGCIVNGPGEMADADYGYIGSGRGKVHIYRSKDPIFKNIPENEAINKLLQLIEEDRK